MHHHITAGLAALQSPRVRLQAVHHLTTEGPPQALQLTVRCKNQGYPPPMDAELHHPEMQLQEQPAVQQVAQQFASPTEQPKATAQPVTVPPQELPVLTQPQENRLKTPFRHPRRNVRYTPGQVQQLHRTGHPIPEPPLHRAVVPVAA